MKNDSLLDYSIPDKNFVLWIVANQVRDILYQARESELRQYDLTTAQAVTLDIIDRVGGKSTASEIARRQLRRPRSIAVILTRMVRQGLVKRATKPDKKGQIFFTLTEKGKRSLEKAMKNESIHEIMSYLSENELEELIGALTKLRNNAVSKTTDIKKMLFPQLSESSDLA